MPSKHESKHRRRLEQEEEDASVGYDNIFDGQDVEQQQQQYSEYDNGYEGDQSLHNSHWINPDDLEELEEGSEENDLHNSHWIPEEALLPPEHETLDVETMQGMISGVMDEYNYEYPQEGQYEKKNLHAMEEGYQCNDEHDCSYHGDPTEAMTDMEPSFHHLAKEESKDEKGFVEEMLEYDFSNFQIIAMGLCALIVLIFVFVVIFVPFRGNEYDDTLEDDAWYFEDGARRKLFESLAYSRP